MNYIWMIIIFAGIMLLAIMVSLAVKPRFVQRLLGLSIFVSAVAGLIIYGYSYGYNASNAAEVFAAAEQTVFTTSSMFVGKYDYSSFSKAISEITDNKWPIMIFWFFHLMALYATASAMLATLGDRFLRAMRLWMLRFKEVVVIYGNGTEVETLLKEAVDDNRNVLIVSKKFSNDEKSRIANIGGLYIAESELPKDIDDDSTRNRSFLDFMGISANANRHSDVIVFADNDQDAQKFLLRLFKNLDAAMIPPENISIKINCNNEYDYVFAQDHLCKGRNNQYYSVDVFCSADIIARKLIRVAPPYKAVSFNDNLEADKDFKLLILGFGDVGEAVLKQIIMNAQFLGSEFSALVVDKDIANIAGKFKTDYSEMIEKYNIKFADYNVMSLEFWKRIKNDDMSEYDYIVVCLGDDYVNRECANKIKNSVFVCQQKTGSKNKNDSGVILAECNRKRITVHGCTKNDPRLVFNSNSRNEKTKNEEYSICDLNSQLYGEFDKMAFAINENYLKETGNTEDPGENWRKLTPFTRASNRATADYIDVVLTCAGIKCAYNIDSITSEDIVRLVNDINSLSKDKIDKLAQLEHRRWMAFHYASGVVPMSLDEMVARSAMKKAGDASIGKIQKDIPACGIGGRHACMVEWDELDEVSDCYNSCTGEKIDYKQYDIETIKNIFRFYIELMDKKEKKKLNRIK